MFDKLSQAKLFLITSLIAISCNIFWGTAFPTLKIVYAEMGIVSSDLVCTIIFIIILGLSNITLQYFFFNIGVNSLPSIKLPFLNRLEFSFLLF